MAIVFQIENRSDENLEALMGSVRDWAEERNYEYREYGETNPDMCHYWQKPFKLREIMNENPETEYILWFDSDIYVYDFRKDPIDYMTDDLDFVAAHDPDDPKDTEDWFNAGVFCVRNSESGRRLVDKWISLYDASKWSKDAEGKWVTEDRWAGPNYEQGAFCEQILQKSEFKNKIKILPSTVFNELFNWKNPGPECFSVHLMRGLAKKTGIKCIWEHRRNALIVIFIAIKIFSFILMLLANQV
jgi:hypothetical protein